MKAIRDLGGTVTDRYWIINAFAIEIDPQHLPTIARFKGVFSLHPNTARRRH